MLQAEKKVIITRKNKVVLFIIRILNLYAAVILKKLKTLFKTSFSAYKQVIRLSFIQIKSLFIMTKTFLIKL